MTPDLKIILERRGNLSYIQCFHPDAHTSFNMTAFSIEEAIEKLTKALTGKIVLAECGHPIALVTDRDDEESL